jgi:hypothetical protein
MRRMALQITGMLLLLAGAGALAMQAPAGVNTSRLDKALQDLAQKYPELVGPERPGQYDVNLVVTGDGRVLRSNLGFFGFRSQELDDEMGRELDQLGIPRFADTVATPIPDSGPGVAKIAMGQPMGGAGKAASNIILNYRMLPADYDESRSALRVEAAVQARHTDLMVREVSLLETPEQFREAQRRALISGMPQLTGPDGQPAPARQPATPPRQLSDINVLTLFMNEDGSIARERIESRSADELLAQYAATEPSPYSFWNPPPVAAGEFAALGLEAGQIGATGYVIVHARQPEHGIAAPMLPGVVVRYAWPRQSAATAGQELVNMKASDLVMAATWTRQPGTGVLKVQLTESAVERSAAPSTFTDPANPASRITTGEMERLGIVNVGDLRGTNPRGTNPGVPCFRAPRQVEVWLLKADGTRTMPARRNCAAEPAGSFEIVHEFPVDDGGPPVAAAIRIDDKFYIDQLLAE